MEIQYRSADMAHLPRSFKGGRPVVPAAGLCGWPVRLACGERECVEVGRSTPREISMQPQGSSIALGRTQAGRPNTSPRRLGRGNEAKTLMSTYYQGDACSSSSAATGHIGK